MCVRGSKRGASRPTGAGGGRGVGYKPVAKTRACGERHGLLRGRIPEQPRSPVDKGPSGPCCNSLLREPVCSVNTRRQRDFASARQTIDPRHVRGLLSIHSVVTVRRTKQQTKEAWLCLTLYTTRRGKISCCEFLFAASSWPCVFC